MSSHRHRCFVFIFMIVAFVLTAFFTFGVVNGRFRQHIIESTTNESLILSSSSSSSSSSITTTTTTTSVASTTNYIRDSSTETIINNTSPSNNEDHNNITVVDKFRRQLVQVSIDLQLQYEMIPLQTTSSSSSSSSNNNDKANTTYIDNELIPVNMTTLYDVVDTIINQLGVEGFYFDIFDDGSLYWWFALLSVDSNNNNNNNTKRHSRSEYSQCWKTHGTTDCDIYEPWWFYHYIGTMTAEKLLQDGRVLWKNNNHRDDVPVYVTSVSQLLHNIHKAQDHWRHESGDMSYHATHGIIWYSIARLYPNLTDYPFNLSERYCGDYYGYHKVHSTGADKNIGYECYHGIGHAIWLVIARRQLQSQSQQSISSKVQYRPSNGFTLSNESVCEIYDICVAPALKNMTRENGYSTDVSQQCFGGALHSRRIFAVENDMRWHYTTAKADRMNYFLKEMEHCSNYDENRHV